MQYHLNGFRPGDPDIRPAAPGRALTGGRTKLPVQVDVLIVGCGPAGLCLAAQMAQFPDIHTMIVEQKPGPIEKGQADGLNVRSMEMFQAFGLAEKIKRESYWVNETTFWVPDRDNPDHIKRIGQIRDVADDQSEMPHTLMNQARIHELFLDVMRNSPSRLEPDYSLSLRDLTIDTETGDHPVTVTLERVGGGADGETVTVKANYVVGCDGARSNVRKAIGGELHGDAAHQAWGVMDILATTDFPDIRMKCLIQSAKEGNILVLPREGGYLLRMYVELDKLNPEERVGNRNLTFDDMIGAANRIMKPYSIDVKEVVWWSIYEIGHRMTDKFDDVPENAAATRAPRVFTAGDACHTHSPKAGQGMNVSMGDTLNLGWKLAHVLTGRAAPGLLSTYSAERWAAARMLVETDHKWARVMSAPPGESELDDGSGLPRFASLFKQNLVFTGGLAVCYEPSVLTGDTRYQGLATGLPVGERFHSAPVIRLADARPLHLGHVAQADGRWRLYTFAGAGDNGQPGGAIDGLCSYLEQDPESPVRKYTRDDEDIDGLLDVRAVFQQGFGDIEYGEIPSLLRPAKGRYGLQDYEKAFCADLKGGQDIYDMRGIDRSRGCMVLVRPDQYIAQILPLTAHAELSTFFDGFLLPLPAR